MSEPKTCFVIAPIGEPDSDIRKRSDQILKHIITPAITECGYEPIRADQISEPGIITRQIIQHIIDDPLVIADLSGRNPNVFYELAIRHAIRKPLVQIISKGEQIPFDVAATRVIIVDHQDLDSVAEARNQIAKQINVVTKDPSKVDSPISMSIDLQNLKQSDTPEQRSLADIIETVSEMNLGIKNIQNVLESESVLQNKESFRDISVAIEKIIDRTHFFDYLFKVGIEKWIMPPGIDEPKEPKREQFVRNIISGFDEIHYMLEDLKHLLKL